MDYGKEPGFGGTLPESVRFLVVLAFVHLVALYIPLTSHISDANGLRKIS